MGLLSRTVDTPAAEKALADAEALVAHWEAEATAAGAEHADLLTRSGANVLDRPEDSGRIADQMSRLDARQRLAGNAVVEARRRVEAAQRAVLVAWAADVRQRAARLPTTVAVRQRKTDRLLAEVREHEDCDFVPFRPEREPTMSAMVAVVTVPWSAIAARTVAQIEEQAAVLERLAGDGTAEQVAAAVGRPVLEPMPVEKLSETGILVAG